MNLNDVIAHYAAERLHLIAQLEQAKAQVTQLEEKLKQKDAAE